jgi:hypothetical protein
MDKEAQKKLADDFVELLRTTNRDGIEELILYLQEETDFFTAPASAKYHGAFAGGLLMHSINVCAELRLDPNSKVYPPETIIIVALLHDICKANCYRTEKRNVKENGGWVEKQIYVFEDELPLGHGEKSLYLASKFIKLSDEEAAAIRWHMGAFDCAFRGGDRGLNAAYEKYPLAVLLHMADMRATYLVERSDDHDR